jgi:hypothetical protein
MKVSIVEINEHQYRYGYDNGKTVYLGPVGDAPEISEEEFFDFWGRERVALKDIWVPDSWSMYGTTQGRAADRRLTKAAQNLLDRAKQAGEDLDKGKLDARGEHNKIVIKALKSFMNTYASLYVADTGDTGAWDSEPRYAVRDFARKVARGSDIGMGGDYEVHIAYDHQVMSIEDFQEHIVMMKEKAKAR